MPDKDRIDGYARVYDDFERQHPQSQQKCFRLLKIHAGAMGERLRITLFPASLQTAAYEALSYTWGDPLPQNEQGSNAEDEWEDVEDSEDEDSEDEDEEDEDEEEEDDDDDDDDDDAKGTPEEKETVSSNRYEAVVNTVTVALQPNLFGALVHIRQSHRDRVLWADYLCINQNSLEDRAAQVKLMDQVYANAMHTVIWLGDMDSKTEQSLREIELLATGEHLSTIFGINGTASRDEVAARLLPVAQLLRRRWFDRMWVIQEAVLSKNATVMIGTRSLPWSTLVKATRAFQSHLKCCEDVVYPSANTIEGDTDAVDDVRFSLASIAALDSITNQSLNLHEALRIFSNRSCTDDRDRIFALLGILQDRDRLVEPDYQVDVAELYKEVIVKIVKNAQDLAILMDLDEYTGSEIDLPWWCVDWNSLGILGVQYWPLFKASGGLTTEIIERCTADTLSLEGIFIDRITYSFSDVDSEDDPQAQLHVLHKTLQSWETAARLEATGGDDYAAGGKRADAFWKTVLMGTNPQSTSLLTDDDSQDYDRWRRWLDAYSSSSSKQRSQTIAEAMAEPVLRAYNNLPISNRVFFETDDGYFGLGPKLMEAGDYVAVLAGGNTPFVVRYVDSDCDVCDADQSRCQLLGWSYIHGFMRGEAVRTIESGEERWRKFCLL